MGFNILNIYPNPIHCCVVKDYKRDIDISITDDVTFEFQFHHIQSLKPLKKQTIYGLSLLEPYYSPTGITNERLFIVKKSFINEYYKQYINKIYHQFLFELFPKMFINFNIVELFDEEDITSVGALNTISFIKVVTEHEYKSQFINFNYPVNEREIRFVLPQLFKNDITEDVIQNILTINNYVQSQFALKLLID